MDSTNSYNLKQGEDEYIISITLLGEMMIKLSCEDKIKSLTYSKDFNVEDMKNLDQLFINVQTAYDITELFDDILTNDKVRIQEDNGAVQIILYITSEDRQINILLNQENIQTEKNEVIPIQKTEEVQNIQVQENYNEYENIQAQENYEQNNYVQNEQYKETNETTGFNNYNEEYNQNMQNMQNLNENININYNMENTTNDKFDYNENINTNNINTQEEEDINKYFLPNIQTTQTTQTNQINEIIKPMGCVRYADDLERFIEGQIGFEEIQSFRLQQEIISALQNAFYYSKREHDLYEKLCYAHMLHAIQNYDPYALYAYYLVAKDKCSPHKLDWDSLLEKIKMESGMDEGDMGRGRGLYEGYVRRGSRGYVLPPDDDDDY